MKNIHKFVLLLGIIAFWTLRVSYWNMTFELPFSDMADYDMIAHRILKNRDFSHSSFYQSYQSPVLPLIRAAQITLLRNDAMISWQFFLAILTFFALLWLMFEMGKATRNRWLGVGLLWIVALSRSSIFWSYKIATESTSELFIYLVLATTLASIRIKNKAIFFMTGALYIAAALNRPNFLIALPFFLAGFMITHRKKIKKITPLIVSFCLGVGLVWTPWLLRSYRLYNGGIVPFNTHGPYTFFFDLGDVTIRINKDRSITTSFWKLALDSPKRFRNDYEFYVYSNMLVKQWLQDNWRSYIGIYFKRIPFTIEKTTDLTKVSRTKLFPNPVNNLLIDKSYLAIISGSLGLIVFAFLFPAFFFNLPVVGILSWLNGLIIVHSPRMLEPVIPIILFGNFGWIYLIKKLVLRKRK